MVQHKICDPDIIGDSFYVSLRTEVTRIRNNPVLSSLCFILSVVYSCNVSYTLPLLR